MREIELLRREMFEEEERRQGLEAMLAGKS
jgi:hypothetical protein